MTVSRRTIIGAAGAALAGVAHPVRSETIMPEELFAESTPVHVGRVGLLSRDAKTLAAYYRSVVGLDVLSETSNHVTLGFGGRPLLEIEQSAAVRPDDPRSAGLFHTAFLLPSRVELGRWIRHAMENQIRIDGVADHLVSEAIYLSDPDGNGIEIYADRHRKDWPTDGGRLRMTSDPLNVDSILKSVPAGAPAWSSAPEGSLVGHVHLRVGDARRAEAFWNEELKFDTMVNYGEQAVFLSTGGYHHHIGANSWQSRGAGPREHNRTGLQWVELLSREPSAAGTVTDPWGTEIRITPAA